MFGCVLYFVFSLHILKIGLYLY